MDTKYIIKDTTLSDIADAIRGKNGETDKIKTIDFATKISEIDLSTLEYMTIVDASVDYLLASMLPTYSDEEVERVDNYINFYGGELNG